MQKILSFTKKLIAIPSISGDHSQATDIKRLETYYHILKRFLLELDTIKKP